MSNSELAMEIESASARIGKAETTIDSQFRSSLADVENLLELVRRGDDLDSVDVRVRLDRIRTTLISDVLQAVDATKDTEAEAEAEAEAEDQWRCPDCEEIRFGDARIEGGLKCGSCAAGN